MNRLFLLLLFGVMTFVAHAQVPDYVPTEGLVGWWGFENNLLDASSNGLDLQNQGCSFQADRNGYATGALTCEGDASMAWTFMPHVESAFSVSIWCKLNTLFEYGAYSWVEYGQNLIGSSGSTGWNLGIDSANLYAYYFYASQNEGGCPSIGGDISGSTASEWFHLVGVRDESSIRLYFNGTLVTTEECPASASMNYINNELRFANRDNASPGAIRSVDDAGIWDRSLTEEEILALYNAPAPAPGCIDPTACNFDAEATSDDGSCIPSGCMEPLACNYNALAECEGEACDYTCCPGPGCCGPGMHWDYNAAQCAIDESCEDDLDGDGVIGVNDLMQLLSSFGTDCTPAVEVNETPVVEDALYVLDHSIFNQPEAFTIAARTAFNGPEATAIVYHQVDGGEMQLSHTNGVLNFQVKASYGNCFTASGWVYAQTELADNNHHHIVATYSRISGEITLSIDGEVQVIQPVNDGDLADCNVYEASIGSESVQNWNLVEIGFYEFAWTEDQIADYSACAGLADLDLGPPAVLLPVGSTSEEAGQILNEFSPMQILGSPGVISCD